jgi:hypothetical protein
VASDVTGATATAKFQSLVNKKLACCMNPYDPSNPSQLKYDCVDNTKNAAAKFDDLWTGLDPSDSGSQPYASVLSSGGNGMVAGKAISGFYTLGGARCSEFSEFSGVIRAATVNPGQISGQQNQVGAGGTATCEIVPGAYTVTPPTALTSSILATGKKIPYDAVSTSDCTQAQNMRRCPILVRSAIVTTCPRNPMAPLAQNSYTDSSGVTHCLAASVIRFFVRIEQIYTITGIPIMPTIDTFQNASSANSLSISSIIQSKVGMVCPAPALAPTSQHNNTCMGCIAGCGGQQCGTCAEGTYSNAGDTQCTPCLAPNIYTAMPGPSGTPGATSSAACTNVAP